MDRRFALLVFIVMLCMGFGACQGQVSSPPTSPLPDPKAHLLYQDSQDRFWYAGSEGLYYAKAEVLRQFTFDDGLLSYSFTGVQEDKKGVLYFDGPDGVFSFDGKRFEKLPVADDSTGVTTNWQSGPDDLLFRMGWEHSGPFRYDGSYLHHMPFPESPAEAAFRAAVPSAPYNPYGIYTMYQDSRGALWFGTASMGIYRWDGQHLSWMYEQDLTETPAGGAFGIRSIVEDKEGYFWICKGEGKFHFLPDSNSVEGGLRRMVYKRLPGITASELNGVYFMSMLADLTGAIWILSHDKGIWRYDEKGIR